MALWLVGTSGYVYRDWRTRFYPRALPVRAWLPYYAAGFDTVELNSPFYRLPRAATFRAWAAAVPPEFVFAVKASRFLTHVERLARANVALCLHDWREQPVTGPLTADFVYVRRHGTRRRYGGSYTDAMLRDDAARVAGWTRGGRDVYVYFNNDGRAAAVRNARRLTELLQARAGRRRAA